jgi:nicotinamide riboside kinase
MYVINFFGGPSTGKSTLATTLFSFLKTKYNLRVEYVHEYAKDLVYEKRNNILQNDQLYVFAKQNHMLKMIELSEQIDIIINDSPILLSSIFGNINESISKKFDDFIVETFKSYNNINFLIKRNDSFFQSYGRIEQDVDAAKAIDQLIIKSLEDNAIDYSLIFNDEIEHTLKSIENDLLSKGIIS